MSETEEEEEEDVVSVADSNKTEFKVDTRRVCARSFTFTSTLRQRSR